MCCFRKRHFHKYKEKLETNELTSETYQAAHSRPSILCQKTTGKDVRHLCQICAPSHPDTEPIIGGYRLDPWREPLKPATAMPERVQLMAPQLI